VWRGTFVVNHKTKEIVKIVARIPEVFQPLSRGIVDGINEKEGSDLSVEQGIGQFGFYVNVAIPGVLVVKCLEFWIDSFVDGTTDVRVVKLSKKQPLCTDYFFHILDFSLSTIFVAKINIPTQTTKDLSRKLFVESPL
jgi:hypothetical protein